MHNAQLIVDWGWCCSLIRLLLRRIHLQQFYATSCSNCTPPSMAAAPEGGRPRRGGNRRIKLTFGFNKARILESFQVVGSISKKRCCAILVIRDKRYYNLKLLSNLATKSNKKIFKDMFIYLKV